MLGRPSLQKGSQSTILKYNILLIITGRHSGFDSYAGIWTFTFMTIIPMKNIQIVTIYLRQSVFLFGEADTFAHDSFTL